MYKKKVLSLYRDILRTTKKIKVNPIRNKIAFNAREMIEVNKDFKNNKIIERLIEEGRNSYNLLVELNNLKEPVKSQIFLDIKRWD